MAAVHPEPGAAVGPGRLLVVVEAMKMEHRIEAAAEGTVAELLVRPGDRVGAGQLLLVLG